MAISVIDRVWKKSSAKANGLLLMLAIADHANEHGLAWPGFRTLQEKTKIASRETIANNLRQLEITGELIIEHGKGPHGTHWYQVCSGLTLEKVDQMRAEKGLPSRQELEQEKEGVVQPPNHPAESEVVQPPNHTENGEVVQSDEKGGSISGGVVQSQGQSGSATEPNPFKPSLNQNINQFKDFDFEKFLAAYKKTEMDRLGPRNNSRQVLEKVFEGLKFGGTTGFERQKHDWKRKFWQLKILCTNDWVQTIAKDNLTNSMEFFLYGCYPLPDDDAWEIKFETEPINA